MEWRGRGGGGSGALGRDEGGPSGWVGTVWGPRRRERCVCVCVVSARSGTHWPDLNGFWVRAAFQTQSNPIASITNHIMSTHTYITQGSKKAVYFATAGEKGAIK